MKKLFAIALGISTLAAPMLGTPALAQQTDRVLVLYGNDKCPTNASGEQIVVCTRRPEGERYRIPKELRTPILITPENQSWAAKANDTLNAGSATGTGSCSAVGAGGWTGCWAQQMRDAKRQRQQDAVESSAPNR
ncbi:hypothetical protein [Sphingomonas sp. SUN039]|uniref:hypothetical protein n=1 Tax=Sphingomonas sp. SUN039 TaxID=2937787 RepID=UPI002164029B|nr:hypothetical protein [Sphingomonas sp. SUN039]UVO54939.1 hypothetical protein M0209_12690 [Sphingomonas sp. SUN039]